MTSALFVRLPLAAFTYLPQLHHCWIYYHGILINLLAFSIEAFCLTIYFPFITNATTCANMYACILYNGTIKLVSNPNECLIADNWLCTQQVLGLRIEAYDYCLIFLFSAGMVPIRYGVPTRTSARPLAGAVRIRRTFMRQERASWSLTRGLSAQSASVSNQNRTTLLGV
jgi:hypothetical protein